jgi:Fe-S-cluster containining protein
MTEHRTGSDRRPPTPAAAATSDPDPEDLGEALRFVHLLEAHTRARVAELSATVQALLEVLVGEGQLPIDRYEERKRLTTQRENALERQGPGIEITAVADKYALALPAPIDCAARLPLCQARCCRRSVVLSVQDLDERVVRWSYARPYVIAQRGDGSCVHLEDGRCAVYAHRPAVCRVYHCRDDRRIWLDFDARVPAPPDPGPACAPPPGAVPSPP